MDLSRVDEVRALLLEAVTRVDGPADIVVDLSGLTFCDSAGLSLLLRAGLQAVESGHTLRLAEPNAQMLRLLEITGSLPLFFCCDTRPSGCASRSRTPARSYRSTGFRLTRPGPAATGFSS